MAATNSAAGAALPSQTPTASSIVSHSRLLEVGTQGVDEARLLLSNSHIARRLCVSCLSAAWPCLRPTAALCMCAAGLLRPCQSRMWGLTGGSTGGRLCSRRRPSLHRALEPAVSASRAPGTSAGVLYAVHACTTLALASHPLQNPSTDRQPAPASTGSAPSAADPQPSCRARARSLRGSAWP